HSNILFGEDVRIMMNEIADATLQTLFSEKYFRTTLNMAKVKSKQAFNKWTMRK
ncbi:hypothetical protein RUND412_006468, partial [Rhizina undulata]